MSTQATFVRHFESDRVQEIIAEGLRIVAELEITDDLRVAAFAKACDLTAAGSLVVAQPTQVAFPGLFPDKNGRRMQVRALRAAREAWFPLAYCVAFCVAVLALYLELR